ncbi:preprotein translocase subunit SecA [Streptomyces sp. NPDC093249]|uniref:preprotein translocase subunit SecA n=1 Tax=unclassified Streptomyces TaxID=2593676 RepID=UPI00380F768F
MASRSNRRKARNKRQRHADQTSPAFDVHSEAMAGSWDALAALMEEYGSSNDPVAAVDSALDYAIEQLVKKLQRFDPIRLIEVARLAFLPIAPEGEMPVTADAGAAQLELLALIALAACQESEVGSPTTDPVEVQEMSRFVSEAKDSLVHLLRLTHLRSLAAADPNDKLAVVTLRIQSSEVWVRNSSYPEMIEATNLALLDEDPAVRAALQADLGFDAANALAVLNACHELQVASMNERMNEMRSAMTAAMDGEPAPTSTECVRSAFTSLFEPDAERATVSLEGIVAHSGISKEIAKAVIERFRLDLKAIAAEDVVNDFSAGKNPMRIRPLIVDSRGRVMLAHPALNAVAIRENLEQYLKSSTVWTRYAKHRGDLLESRTRIALSRVLPTAHYRDAFEYYVPANSVEEQNADPSKYTKLVEGDHLAVIDDVAIIVEDKAVALSSLSRGGKTTRIRTDLTGIITKAADQAGRMRDCIERDGGLRTKKQGWVDLKHIREIHTVAVSLDDISTVLTATAELVRAGLLDLGNIPWTVSLHDLEIITELVDRPAEFLLYLRRRRIPDVTVMFSAADELDLFLHFFEAGLWVEPDPAQVRASFPFMPEPTTGQLRRYRSQQPVLLSSRTDALDRWFHGKQRAGTAPAEPKPKMAQCPIVPLVDELHSRNVTGWLSIGATLLSAATPTQHQFARNANDLLDNPSPVGKGRSLAVPVTGSVDPTEGWLLVWATRPPGADLASEVKHLSGYLRAKKGQLGMPRGVVFLYDEPTRELIGAYYDGHVGPLDKALTSSLSYLRPATDLHGRLHPNAKKSPRSKGNSQRTGGK